MLVYANCTISTGVISEHINATPRYTSQRFVILLKESQKDTITFQCHAQAIHESLLKLITYILEAVHENLPRKISLLRLMIGLNTSQFGVF